jgi:hypothetical protein
VVIAMALALASLSYHITQEKVIIGDADTSVAANDAAIVIFLAVVIVFLVVFLAVIVVYIFV